MDRFLTQTLIVRAPQAFPVDGDDLSAGILMDRLHPPHKTTLKGFRVQARKDPPEGVSCEGIPFGSTRKVRNHLSLAFPNFSIPVQPSAPQITAQMAMVMMSSN